MARLIRPILLFLLTLSSQSSWSNTDVSKHFSPIKGYQVYAKMVVDYDTKYKLLSYSLKSFDEVISVVKVVSTANNKELWSKVIKRHNPTKILVIENEKKVSKPSFIIGFYDAFYKFDLITGRILVKKENLFEKYSYQALKDPKVLKTGDIWLNEVLQIDKNGKVVSKKKVNEGNVK